MRPGSNLLLDDGKLRLVVKKEGKDCIDCEVLIGGRLTDRKGVNIPDAVLAVSPLTKKDREDLRFGLDLGADWIALSFVQRPEDIAEARRLIAGRARILAKLEKPAAIEHLEEIIELSDAVMVARGDLGRRAAAGRRARPAEADRGRQPQGRQAGGGRDADAGIDDKLADADPCRGLRRRDRDL